MRLVWNISKDRDIVGLFLFSGVRDRLIRNFFEAFENGGAKPDVY